MTIFGHTPTFSFGDEYEGKIIKTDTWIDIDVGAGFGRNPVMLRLEDMEEIRMCWCPKLYNERFLREILVS